ncbi:carboxypeptidase-like regulatory domain-containing protein [Bacteroidota bacterium]
MNYLNIHKYFNLKSNTLQVFLLLLLSLLTAETDNPIHAQDTGSIRGFISDSTNGEPISYANVVIRNTNHGTSTDTKGFYLIAGIVPGNYTVIVSYIGYKLKEVNLVIKKNIITELNVQLNPSSIQLTELQVIADKTVRRNETDLGLQKISAKEIEFIPVSVEADIFKVIQSSPGVSSTSDITGKYYVRGGGGDQNEVLLNGVTLYNPSHALGLFSIIDPEIISVLEFYKGGFSPIYGDRISSVLNIISKDGNKNKFEASAQASLLSAKIALEGPVPNGSFITTARKSYHTKILKNYLNDKEAPIDFYDISCKVNYSNPELDKGSKFILQGFYSNDYIDYEDPLRENYLLDNLLIGSTWRKVWKNIPLISYVNISYSGFKGKVMPNFSETKFRENNLDDFTLKTDFTYVYESKDELQFGIYNKYLKTFLTQENIAGETVTYDNSGWDLSAYFNYKFYRWEKIGLDLGVRSKFIALSKHRPFILQPRFSFTYLPNPLISIKLAAGIYSQEIVTLTNESELISVFEPWIIIPDHLDAPQSLHFIFGIKYYLTEYFTIETEGYYKSIYNLFDINENKFTQRFSDFDNVNGESYGADILIKYNMFPVLIQASYSLSWAYKINSDLKYFPRYDRRHAVNVLLNLNLGNNLNTSAAWNFATGMPLTPIAGFYDRIHNYDNPIWAYGNNFIPSFYQGEKNSKRLPEYHRLDVSILKEFKFSFLDLTLGGSIINVYNRNNIFYFDRKTGERVNMLPMIISGFIKVKI